MNWGLSLPRHHVQCAAIDALVGRIVTGRLAIKSDDAQKCRLVVRKLRPQRALNTRP